MAASLDHRTQQTDGPPVDEEKIGDRAFCHSAHTHTHLRSTGGVIGDSALGLRFQATAILRHNFTAPKKLRQDSWQAFLSDPQRAAVANEAGTETFEMSVRGTGLTCDLLCQESSTYMFPKQDGCQLSSVLALLHHPHLRFLQFPSISLQFPSRSSTSRHFPSFWFPSSALSFPCTSLLFIECAIHIRTVPTCCGGCSSCCYPLVINQEGLAHS